MTKLEKSEHGKKPILWDEEERVFTFRLKSASGKPTQNPIPARFSPVDKYGKYRRMAKKRSQDEQHIEYTRSTNS